MQWALRAAHEAKMYRHNTFLTLTYDDDTLPTNGSLRPKDLTDFWKRLRKSLTLATKIKYLACGEYGATTQRAHYHALIFNYWPADAYSVGKYSQADSVRTLWPHGQHRLGVATPAATHYIAKYSLKQHSNEFYALLQREKPFLRTSQGLGKAWLQQYAGDLTHGYLIHKGRKHRIPRYYIKKLKDGSLTSSGPSPIQTNDDNQRCQHTNYNGVEQNHPIRIAPEGLATLQQQTLLKIKYYQLIHRQLNQNDNNELNDNSTQRLKDKEKIHEQKQRLDKTTL